MASGAARRLDALATHVTTRPRTSPVAADSGGSPADVVRTYKQVEGGSLSLHIFTPPSHKATDARPAVVFFFGGGWLGGSYTQFVPQSQFFASRGMVCICAEYRTESSHGASPFDCVEDGRSVMRWVRGHAAELGIDPNRLGAVSTMRS